MANYQPGIRAWTEGSESKPCSPYGERVDPENRRARYAIGIFGPTFWGRGLGTEASRLVLAYAFEVLLLHRVELRVLAFNERAIACYERCGFRREGVEREGAWIGGEWQSDVIMSILEQEYRAAFAKIQIGG